ncbi:hypothetical protein HJC23_005920 [Cyclotella cryptica]|uniref:Uncharacterized protein n=1 Tax=Cyclotella cryptica TaxID=29204 RepID=A0ABD3R4U2_9STRA
MAENSDDLYGDLENTVVKQVQRGDSNKAFVAPLTSSPTDEAGSVEPNMLQREIASLKAENETLKRNMGILYRTSKAELERKDRTIEMLQGELDAMKQSKTRIMI